MQNYRDLLTLIRSGKTTDSREEAWVSTAQTILDTLKGDLQEMDLSEVLLEGLVRALLQDNNNFGLGYPISVASKAELNTDGDRVLASGAVRTLRRTFTIRFILIRRDPISRNPTPNLFVQYS